MSAITFEIRVEGILDDQSVADLGEVSMTTMAATTVLTGTVADQAALLGLLSRLRAHGLVVIELHRLATDTPVTRNLDAPSDSVDS